jgi:hypothetical protein
MFDQAIYERIERYLTGVSTPEEAALVEKQAAEDPAFAELLALHRELDATLADTETMAFAAALADADAEDRRSKSGNEPQGKIRQLNWQRWAIAASIALIAVVGGVFLLRDKQLSGPQAFDQYFEAYDAPANFRSDSMAIAVSYQTAFDAYNAKDWPKAIATFEEIVQKDSNPVTAQFYLGMSRLSAGDVDGAIRDLRGLAASQHPFTTQSKWYLALALLEKGENSEAKDLLKDLSSGSGKFATLSKELLEKLGE